jgi:hypothetical protein
MQATHDRFLKSAHGNTLPAGRLFAGYSDEEQPFEGYMTLVSIFGSAMAIGLLAASRRGRLPDHLQVEEIAAMALATHKIARLLTKDAVTSFLRAPFVRLDRRSGSNSLKEQPRGAGLQRSIGELVTCPECTGQWVAGALLIGTLHAPRLTRSVTSLYSALAAADLLQFVYAGLKDRA